MAALESSIAPADCFLNKQDQQRIYANTTRASSQVYIYLPDYYRAEFCETFVVAKKVLYVVTIHIQCVYLHGRMRIQTFQHYLRLLKY